MINYGNIILVNYQVFFCLIFGLTRYAIPVRLMTAGCRRPPQDTISVDQVGHISATGRRSPPQDAATVLLYSVLDFP